MDVLFITDTHVSKDNVARTGDFMNDLLDKLRQVYDYADRLIMEGTECCVVHGGDVFNSHVVPQEAYNAFQRFLLQDTHGVDMYCVRGNHDMLYRNDDNNHKTHYQCLVDAGAIIDFTGDDVRFLSSQFDLTNNLNYESHKPCIYVGHSFLDIEDGKFTLPEFDDTLQRNMVMCLGHDHQNYPDTMFHGVPVIRPGALMRLRRDKSNERTPYFVHIWYNDDEGKFEWKNIQLKCKSLEDVFNKREGLSNIDEHCDYETLVSSLRKGVDEREETFFDVVSAITEEDIEAREFIMSQLEAAKAREK